MFCYFCEGFWQYSLVFFFSFFLFLFIFLYLHYLVLDTYFFNCQIKSCSFTSDSDLGSLFSYLSRIYIDIEGNHLILSAKYSLINSAQHLPSELSQIHPNSVVHVINSFKSDSFAFIDDVDRFYCFYYMNLFSYTRATFVT